MQKRITILFVLMFVFCATMPVFAQGVTTANITGFVVDTDGNPLPGANVIATHIPSGTNYGASSRPNGAFDLMNLKIGGPYKIVVSYVGFQDWSEENLILKIAQKLRLDVKLIPSSVEMDQVTVLGDKSDILNAQRTGAATNVKPQEVALIPSVKRSTRDLTRLDPRSDGNFSFGGKNWLFNSISVDGSYFNNSFGLDDPAPGGQANAEPIPFDAIEQVQVSVAPYDVRQGGFTGAGVNTVTKSGTNTPKASLYSFFRNQDMVGNEVNGNPVTANPSLSYNLTGISAGGPIMKNKLFFFVNAEIERREDPGSFFVADRDGNLVYGESRVSASVMDQIRKRMKDVYGYETGPYENYFHKTENEKLLIKLDWNISDKHNFTFRYNRLDARREQGPHPFVLSPNSTGRGPNSQSLPFKNSGYRINNRLNSFAAELNSRFHNASNRFFASYSRFRDYRDPFSEPFPTVDIAENGVTYTTLGHEPFSIHNILDQDVLQITNNFSYYMGDHVFTAGATFEYFSFFNSFNIFHHGVFFLPFTPPGSTFLSLNDFFNATDPANPVDLRGLVGGSPYKGEFIDVAQLGVYLQDEYIATKNLSLNFGLRMDMPIYFTEPKANPYSTGLTLLDENGDPEVVDQAKLPGATPLFSPRIGFNWDVNGDRSMQLRGGTGVFTGRLPFVWIGNVISNPGSNPNLYPGGPLDPTKNESTLMQSFDLNAMVDDFKWPQVWTTNLAIDKELSDGWLGTVEFIYGKDINAVYVRNADLVAPQKYLADGRPYYGGAGNNELNAAYPGEGAGAYVIDNTDKGYHMNITAQLRKEFDFGLSTMLAYNFLEAKSVMKSTEIASVLWQANPTKGDPNNPELGYSEFGQQHRAIASFTYKKEWSKNWATSFGLFCELGRGNRFTVAGGNRYSFTYAGDVNGDGQGGNDLLYIPKSMDDNVQFVDYVDAAGNTVSAAYQWTEFNKFIAQDDYLSENRGKFAERFGLINPWYFNIDLRVLQDFAFKAIGQVHRFQLSLDVLNVPNLISSSWGVRQVASPAATSPLEVVGISNDDRPQVNFKHTDLETFTDDPSIFSRWQLQIGLRYILN